MIDKYTTILDTWTSLVFIEEDSKIYFIYRPEDNTEEPKIKILETGLFEPTPQDLEDAFKELLDSTNLSEEDKLDEMDELIKSEFYKAAVAFFEEEEE